MADVRVRIPVSVVDPTTPTTQAGVAALTDNFANPTALAVGAFLMFWDGANWDRASGAGGILSVDTELPAAAALSDNFANPTAPAVGAFAMLWDGATWDRWPGNSVSGGLVDTELPAAAVLADNTANPTVPGVGAFLMGWDGVNWDRISAVAGVLQVDVLSGGGEVLPTGATYNTASSAALAAGASANLDSAEIVETEYIAQIGITSSVAFKGVIQEVNNGVATSVDTIFGLAGETVTWRPAHRRYVDVAATAGVDVFRVVITNMDTSQAADFYATFYYQNN